VVRGTFSPARAWHPAVVARLARTLGRTKTVRRPCNHGSHTKMLEALTKLHDRLLVLQQQRSVALIGSACLGALVSWALPADWFLKAFLSCIGITLLLGVMNAVDAKEPTPTNIGLKVISFLAIGYKQAECAGSRNPLLGSISTHRRLCTRYGCWHGRPGKQVARSAA